jgi:hypothetical protein
MAQPEIAGDELDTDCSTYCRSSTTDEVERNADR